MSQKWPLQVSLSIQEIINTRQENWILCPCPYCNTIREVIKDSTILDAIYPSLGEAMNEETKKIIAGYPEISIEDARLIFIRQKGREDWKNKSLNFLSLIETPTPIHESDRNSAIAYISFLKTMIKELRAYSDGASQEYSREIAPEILESHKERESLKDSKKSSPKTLEGMLAKAGFTKEQFLTALKARAEVKK